MDFDTQVKNFMAEAAKNGMSPADVQRAIARLQSQKTTKLQSDGAFATVYNRDGLVAEWKTDGSQGDRASSDARGAEKARADLARMNQAPKPLKPLRMVAPGSPADQMKERQRSAEAADPSTPGWKRPLRLSV